MTVIIRVNPAQIGPFQGFLKLSVGRGYEWGGSIIPWSFEIFLSLTSFGDSLVNSYLPILLLIITFRFTCCERNFDLFSETR